MSTVEPDFTALQSALAGQYSLVRELGRGGMGVVYLAREVELDRLVAIKVLPPSLASRPGLRERFLREARLAAGLSHPHIVPIFRVGEVGEFVFFAMMLVDGETLGTRLATRGPLSPAAAARMMREVAWALAYAHGRGIIHRDIKPDNILIEAHTERALVTDFGIAHVATASDGGAEPIMGTRQFMSPEQASGGSIDGRSDLYALGVVGHLALTGRLPAGDETLPAEATGAVATAEARKAIQVASSAGVPPRMMQVIERCLAHQASARYATGEALADALSPAAAERRQLPLPLRVWLTQQDPGHPIYMAWGVATGAAVVAALLVEQLTVGEGVRLVMLPFLPVVPSSFFVLRQTRRVIASGYSLADLRHAIREHSVEESEATAFERAEVPPKVRRALVLAPAVSFGVAVLGGIIGPTSGVLTPGQWSGLMLASTSGFLVSLIARAAAGMTLPGIGFEKRLRASARERFWNSRLGEWFAKLAAGTTRPHAVNAELVHRPTEMAIALASDQLFAALPKAYREHLADLPDVVRQLESQAKALRTRIESVNDLLGRAESAEVGDDARAGDTDHGAGLVGDRRRAVTENLRATRDEARERLRRTVAALETVRLDLLRLQGGVSDTSSLTTVLEAAKQVSRSVGALTTSQREASELVRKVLPRRPAHTPA